MHQTLFYVSHDGTELGPLSLEDIRQSLADKKISELDYIYVEEVEDWLVLSEFLKEEEDSKTPVARPETERRKSSPSESESESESFINLLPDDITHTDVAENTSHLVSTESGLYSLPQEEETVDTQLFHQHFNFEAGSAEILLEELRPGKLEILVALEGDQASHREELKVQGGEPFEIKVEAPSLWKATDEKKIVFQVVDEFGEPCPDFHGSISIHQEGAGPLQVTLKGARTEHLFECHKTGTHTLKFQNCVPTLRHTESLTLEVQPGEPTSLKVRSEGPPRAGQPHRVVIQAFDAYGNLATTFDGPLKIEVLEHPSVKRPGDAPSLRIQPLTKKTG